MTIIEILQGSNKDIRANIDLLAKDYLEKIGKKLNKGCSACVIEMVLTLKNFYKMTQFKFKRHAAMYKNNKGDKTTISNSTMTDEKAIAFLKTNPKRIELFSEYPSNWKDLVAGKAETEEQKEARLAAEAEAKAAKEGKKEGKGTETKTEGGKGTETGTGKGSEKPAHEELMKMSLADLRKKYPDVKATSIKDFVDKILAD